MDREIAPSPLSFDTSLVKFFCKTPETDKTDSGVKRVPKKQEKKPEKAERPKPSHSRFLFETDPSFEDISLDLIKNMGHEDSRVSKDKFDGNLNIEFFFLNIFTQVLFWSWTWMTVRSTTTWMSPKRKKSPTLSRQLFRRVSRPLSRPPVSARVPFNFF